MGDKMTDFTFKILDDDTVAVMSYVGDEKEVTIPDEYWGRPVTVINDDMFRGHAEIEEVHIPNTVTNIGGFVFDGCEKLKTVILPSGLQEMWQYAFVRSGIEIIEIPGSVKHIVPFTFAECKNLRLVVCHEGTEKIRSWAFKDCSNLQMVAVNSMTEIMHDAFEGCDNIDPDMRVKVKGSCKCPKCTGAGKPIDVMSMLGRK